MSLRTIAGSPARDSANGLRAVILAGGKGVRLQPFTASFPKPLVPLGDIPIVEVLMRRLITYGITDITLTVGHLAELLKAYFQHRKEITRQIQLDYVTEELPTGTAGSLAAVDRLTETFLVMNGDLLTDLNFDELVAFHRAQKAILTIAAHRRRVKIDLGVLEFGSDRRVIGYREKPETEYYVSMGVYVYEPLVLQHIQPGTYLDFPDLVVKLIGAGEKVCAFPAECLWLDVGRPDDYAQAQQLFAERQEALLAEHVKIV